MRYVIIYNPLSSDGKREKTFTKLAKSLKVDKSLLIRENIINITNIDDFFLKYSKDDIYVVVGGDGTLNSFANLLNNKRYEQKIYLYQAGTGNDFARSIKKRGKLINLNNLLYDLPIVKLNDDLTKMFVNGIGIGIDGLVCYNVNNHPNKNNPRTYFKLALKSMKESNKFDIEVINENNEKEIIKNVWFVTVMNSKYFGGGMKIAPKQTRNDQEMTLIIVRNFKKWLLPIIFPTIYLGIHTSFKKNIIMKKVKRVKVLTSDNLYAQIDGDDYALINEIEVMRKGE